MENRFRANHKQVILTNRLALYKKIVIIINTLLVIIIFIAGLWPFEFTPKNSVFRLRKGNGIVFQKNGLVYENKSSANFLSFLKDSSTFSIEIILKPDIETATIFAAILSIYDDYDPELLIVAKWKNHLILRRRIPLPDGTYSYHEVNVNNIILPENKCHVIISLDRKGAIVFINGKKEKSFPDFCLRFGNENPNNYRIILGNEPRIKVPWIGEINGLAIYTGLFNESDASNHYRYWANNDYKSLAKKNGIIAIYPMKEITGSVIRNIISNNNNLVIPKYLFALKKSVLAKPWINFWQYKEFYYDIVLNILGFIPLGFFLAAFFLFNYTNKPFLLYYAPIIVGSCISLSIELIQVYIPARTSSITDFLCNILGTILGVILFHKVHKVYLVKMKKPEESGLSIK